MKMHSVWLQKDDDYIILNILQQEKMQNVHMYIQIYTLMDHCWKQLLDMDIPILISVHDNRNR